MLASLKASKQRYWLYMLELEGGYFYIGITSRHNPQVRINEHFLGDGAAWTKLHEPVRVLSLKDLGYKTRYEAEDVEEIETQKAMDIFGYNNVRGGPLSYSGNYVKYKNKYLQTSVLNSHWV